MGVEENMEAAVVVGIQVSQREYLEGPSTQRTGFQVPNIIVYTCSWHSKPSIGCMDSQGIPALHRQP